MVGDYVTVKEIDNGYLISLNEYCTNRKHCQLVAKDREELLEILSKNIFPCEKKE